VNSAVPWNSGSGEYVRSGKYVAGAHVSWGSGFEVTRIWKLRIEHALGLPVVPD
jgi:hypothetical protein